MRTKPPPDKPEYVTLTLRIPRDLKEQVVKVATDDDRSITNFVIRALKEKLARG